MYGLFNIFWPSLVVISTNIKFLKQKQKEEEENK